MKFFTKYLMRVLFTSMIAFADGDEPGTGGAGGGDDTPPGGDDTPPGGDDTPPGGDDTPPGGDDTPPDDAMRYRISAGKKEVAKRILAGEDPFPKNPKPTDPPNTKPQEIDYSSPAAQEAMQKLLDSQMEGLDLGRLDRITEMERKQQDDAFFGEVAKAGESFKQYGLDIDRAKSEALLKDIADNGFKSEHVILMQNAEFILGKLNMLPKVPMTTDSGQKPHIQGKNVSMADRVSSIWNKHQG